MDNDTGKTNSLLVPCNHSQKQMIALEFLQHLHHPACYSQLHLRKGPPPHRSHSWASVREPFVHAVPHAIVIWSRSRSSRHIKCNCTVMCCTTTTLARICAWQQPDGSGSSYFCVGHVSSTRTTIPNPSEDMPTKGHLYGRML